MNALWSYFWPLFASGLLAGAVAGALAFRLTAAKDRSRKTIVLGLAFVLAAALLWQGPLGGADRFARQVERQARATLDDWAMTQVEARLGRGPLTRNLELSGPADDFQRRELVRIMGALPGVGSARWTRPGGVPLIVEGTAVSIAGFLLGLMLAYLVALRRRYNAQWSW